MDLLVGFEPSWSSDHLSEKKERMDLVGFPRNSSISSEVDDYLSTSHVPWIAGTLRNI